MSDFGSRTRLQAAAWIVLFALTFPVTAVWPAADEEEPGLVESYYEVRMGGSLWETLIENGVNPTLWKDIFEFNRKNNPAFAKISTARRIPTGTIIYIPIEGESAWAERVPGRRATKALVEDTLLMFGTVPTLVIRPGRGQNLNDVLKAFCLPSSIKGRLDQANLLRNIRSDLRYFYRQMGAALGYRDTRFYVPLHLLAEQHEALERKLAAYQSDPGLYLPRDSLFAVSPQDIRHLALEGEDYLDLARRYFGDREDFPEHYPYKNSPKNHLAYMAQQIRHYNLNQPLTPGREYFIPAYLSGSRYYRENPPVKILSRTKEALYYSNGLEVSLEYQVTRKKAYWQRREKYLPALERTFEDGSRAYPDMLLWHRTGLEPEVEDLLRSRGRSQFSLRYIYRMAVSNYYIDERGGCFLIVDPEKNARNHAGDPRDYRCFWNGQSRVSDVAIGIEVESGFFGDLTGRQLETAKKLQEVIRGQFIIPEERILDHRKVACRRGPGLTLRRGRKADGFSSADRSAMGLAPVLDLDVLRGLVDPDLDHIQQLQNDSTDYWYRVQIDPDLETTARKVGWSLIDGLWQRPAPATDKEGLPARSSTTPLKKSAKPLVAGKAHDY